VERTGSWSARRPGSPGWPATTPGPFRSGHHPGPAPPARNAANAAAPTGWPIARPPAGSTRSTWARPRTSRPSAWTRRPPRWPGASPTPPDPLVGPRPLRAGALAVCCWRPSCSCPGPDPTWSRGPGCSLALTPAWTRAAARCSPPRPAPARPACWPPGSPGWIARPPGSPWMSATRTSARSSATWSPPCRRSRPPAATGRWPGSRLRGHQPPRSWPPSWSTTWPPCPLPACWSWTTTTSCAPRMSTPRSRSCSITCHRRCIWWSPAARTRRCPCPGCAPAASSSRCGRPIWASASRRRPRSWARAWACGSPTPRWRRWSSAPRAGRPGCSWPGWPCATVPTRRRSWPPSPAGTGWWPTI
jgi:hypothetical protein